MCWLAWASKQGDAQVTYGSYGRASVRAKFQFDDIKELLTSIGSHGVLDGNLRKCALTCSSSPF